MKRIIIIVLALVMVAVVGCDKIVQVFGPDVSADGKNNTSAVVLNELPFNVEKNNPVPEVKNWEQDGRTIYYFSWGLKNTGGYSLELSKVDDGVINLKAVSPAPGANVTEALTYPALAVSLPAGEYTYEVYDSNGKLLDDFFAVKNEPLKINLFIPYQGKVVERQVLRDPYLNNEGKTTAQIALEALFSQEEMFNFTKWGINVKGASFNEQGWVILLTDAYNILQEEEKNLLDQAITKTVLGLNAQNLQSVTITTNPKDLPPLQN